MNKQTIVLTCMFDRSLKSDKMNFCVKFEKDVTWVFANAGLGGGDTVASLSTAENLQISHLQLVNITL